jgi:type IV pilus assembly protein PilA
MSKHRRRQAGFTVVELIITMCIVAVLASVAIRSMRDYSRRAQVAEVILAATDCKSMISEGYLTRDTRPDAGTWGCETATGKSRYAGAVQTSPNGVIRIAIANLDSVLNGHYVYLAPSRVGGARLTTPDDLGNGVRVWVCGSDSGLVRNSLPAGCRADSTLVATEDYN